LGILPARLEEGFWTMSVALPDRPEIQYVRRRLRPQAQCEPAVAGLPTDLRDPMADATPAPTRDRKWQRRLLLAALVLMSLLVATELCVRFPLVMAGLAVLMLATELIARFRLGLGDPPLSMTDPHTGYQFQPNQTCRRFGNLIHYNAYSMRSDDFPAQKSSRNEFRVLVFGDSVINGGAQTDQSQVCTSILERDLALKLHRPVVVGNISAGAWGPLNHWRYVKSHGLFEADALVIVLTSGSIRAPFPNRRIVGTEPGFPDRKPWCATWEGITRYLPQYLPFLRSPACQGWGFDNENEETVDPQTAARNTARNLDAVQEMLAGAQAAGVETYLVWHWTQAELHRAAQDPSWGPEGLQQFQAMCAAAGVTAVCTRPANAGPADYRDNVHINAQGQKHLAARMTALLATQSRRTGAHASTHAVRIAGQPDRCYAPETDPLAATRIPISSRLRPLPVGSHKMIA
jgi:hypothetical protein